MLSVVTLAQARQQGHNVVLADPMDHTIYMGMWSTKKRRIGINYGLRRGKARKIAMVSYGETKRVTQGHDNGRGLLYYWVSIKTSQSQVTLFSYSLQSMDMKLDLMKQSFCYQGDVLRELTSTSSFRVLWSTTINTGTGS
jgi:hypothetical protein